MSRRPRIHFPGAVYHVMARGVNDGMIFFDDRDREEFLSDLNRIGQETGVNIIAYCLMGNHFHLAAKVGDIRLGTAMLRLLTGFALRSNVRHQRTGHLFQARHKANLCLDEAYLYRLIRYIHLNPVRAGLVADPADWPWSSFSSHPGNQADLTDFEPWPRAPKRLPPLIRNETSLKREIAALSGAIASREGVSIEVVRSRSKLPRIVAVRRLMALEAVTAGHSMTETARWLGLGVSTISRYSRERIGRSESLTP